MACPVTDRAPSPHSHSTASATSRGSMSRPCGLCFTSSASAASRLRPVFSTMRSRLSATRSVSVKPGQTALTVTPVLAVSTRERPHEADDRVLGRAIGAHIGIALQTGGRGDGDDPAEAARDHRTEHRLRRMDDAQKVHVEHAPEERLVGLGERCRDRAAGIGDEDVDRIFRAGGLDGGAQRASIADVGDDRCMRLALADDAVAALRRRARGPSPSRPLQRETGRWRGRCRGCRRSPAACRSCNARAALDCRSFPGNMALEHVCPSYFKLEECPGNPEPADRAGAAEPDQIVSRQTATRE